jgi:PhoPQ-activated pathogenicity-related protein
MHLWPALTIRFVLAGAGLAAATRLQSAESQVLADYIARPDPSFGWTERSSGKIGPTSYVELILVSQEWRGIKWKHQLYVVRPASLKRNSKHAMLVIAGSGWDPKFDDPASESTLPRNASLYAKLAERLRAPVAVLLQVPFQPLFDQLTEDWLIAYTFDQFLKTGEKDWPLLLPMVKSSVRAMDAVQAYTKAKWGLGIETFTVTGASKRGWTTWLTGAVDRRATAIAPMVIDVLSMDRQMEYAKRTWGAPSEKVEPYTKLGLLERLTSPEGRRLLAIVDPYNYRDRLKQPKLIINGTNDEYWVADAANLYWNDLPGEKYLLYVPNNGHSLRDHDRVTGATLALHQHQAGTLSLPKFKWTLIENGNVFTLSATTEPWTKMMRVWTTSSATADLRSAEWTAHDLQPRYGKAEHRVSRNDSYQAFFIEAEFREGRPMPLQLSTTMRVIPPAGHVAPPVTSAP